MVRALQSHQCGPGSIPGVDAIIIMWAEFIVSSRPCSEGFSPGSMVFSLHKNKHFQIPI